MAEVTAPKDRKDSGYFGQGLEQRTELQLRLEADGDEHLRAHLDQTHMVDMFNDNQLFNSEIDTGRSKEATALEDIAVQIAADIEKTDESESNNRIFEYRPA